MPKTAKPRSLANLHEKLIKIGAELRKLSLLHRAKSASSSMQWCSRAGHGLDATDGSVRISLRQRQDQTESTERTENSGVSVS
jgi:hypothetical protein